MNKQTWRRKHSSIPFILFWIGDDLVSVGFDGWKLRQEWFHPLEIQPHGTLLNAVLVLLVRSTSLPAQIHGTLKAGSIDLQPAVEPRAKDVIFDPHHGFCKSDYNIIHKEEKPVFIQTFTRPRQERYATTGRKKYLIVKLPCWDLSSSSSSSISAFTVSIVLCCNPQWFHAYNNTRVCRWFRTTRYYLRGLTRDAL